jgi:predicted KAP-like P-loop ATPase
VVYSDHQIDAAGMDRLDRARVAGALCDLLHAPATETPLVVGIFGDWGTGKTSLMRLLEAELLARGAAEGNQLLTLWFDAWKYARQEQSLWRALLLKVITDLGARVEQLTAEPAQR